MKNFHTQQKKRLRKEKLRKKLESIKVQGDDNVDNDKKLEKLNKFDKELDQINKKLEEVISNIDKLPYPEKDIKLNSSTEKSPKLNLKKNLMINLLLKKFQVFYHQIEKQKLRNIMKQ
ncbi:hypothetical protein NW062_07095 [Mycoplasmopsis cynos]|nr:hypothetical protein NW062_07095 [Mycoplasmopsis cynos]